MNFTKKNKVFCLRLIFSLILIYIIIRNVNINEAGDLLASINYYYFSVALFLVVVERVILAYKWNILLATKNMHLPFMKILKIYYLSSFIGTFLPSSVTGDVFRIYSLYKCTSNRVESLTSVFAEKITALLSSLIIVISNVIFLCYISHMINKEAILHSILLLAVILAIFSVVALKKSIMTSIIDKFKFISVKLEKKIREVYNVFFEYTMYKMALFYVLMLSFVFQLIRILGIYLVSLSLDQHTNIIYFLIFIPIIIFLTMLPISIGGIGIREGGFVYFFSQAGMSTTDAFTLSILVYVLIMISIIPGGIIFVREGLLGNSRELIMGKKRTSEDLP